MEVENQLYKRSDTDLAQLVILAEDVYANYQRLSRRRLWLTVLLALFFVNGFVFYRYFLYFYWENFSVTFWALIISTLAVIIGVLLFWLIDTIKQVRLESVVLRKLLVMIDEFKQLNEVAVSPIERVVLEMRLSRISFANG